jgi:hypothetical protein
MEEKQLCNFKSILTHNKCTEFVNSITESNLVVIVFYADCRRA